ncbi:MAG: AtpZ/AtpI family protein [Deltaproteobacteria bacterium]|nr:AtpZ/AtpI family protein [Deltaproteobacteria bacterium]
MSGPKIDLKRYLRYSTIGLEMGLAVGLGFYAGRWLDARLGSTPWLLLLFTFFGFGAGFLNLWRTLRSLQDEWGQEDRVRNHSGE